MNRNKRCLLLGMLLVVVAAGGIAVWCKFEPVVEWRELRGAKRVFSGVGDITRVEIYRMKGEEVDRTTITFPVRPYGEDYPTYGSVALSGQRAQAFLSVWSQQQAAPELWAMCHYPTYGFRLFCNQELMIETSMCWLCGNYFFPSIDGGYGWESFDPSSSESMELLQLCDSLLPYKRPATMLEKHEMKRAEQGGARRPATAPGSKSEGKEKPKPESEGRSK